MLYKRLYLKTYKLQFTHALQSNYLPLCIQFYCFHTDLNWRRKLIPTNGGFWSPFLCLYVCHHNVRIGVINIFISLANIFLVVLKSVFGLLFMHDGVHESWEDDFGRKLLVLQHVSWALTPSGVVGTYCCNKIEHLHGDAFSYQSFSNMLYTNRERIILGILKRRDVLSQESFCTFLAILYTNRGRGPIEPIQHYFK